MGAITLLLLFAVALIAGPIVAGVAGIPLSTLSATIMTLSGVLLAVVTGMLLIVTRLYVKTKASEALVRTGMGGMRVIKDGGALIIPVVHQIVRISLQTLRLEVSREGGDALITKDKLRADVRAEFFVRVQPDEESIRSAARSFGDHMGDARFVRGLVEDKLVSALRTVAATKTLEELNTERDKFMEQVTHIVAPDLSHNGLTLETATISKLDQTDPRMLRDDNIFDAQGKRTIAEITQQQLTERNKLERLGEQHRKLQDVEARKKLVELERMQAETEAAQRAELAKVQAAKSREAQEKQIEAQRAVELAAVAKQQAIEVALREQQMAVEVAERKKQEAVAQAEAERAAKEAALAQAEALRERERQLVKTVEVEAAAERDKRKQIITAEAEAERKFVEAQRSADAEAYRLEREAAAHKAAAEADAEAITRRAQAEADAARARAEGEKAAALVPVEVERQKVEVERRRVDEVLKMELEAREQHGKAAQEFELAQLRITKEAEVRIEAARATVNLLGKVHAQVFGTPEDVSRMTQALMNGMGISQTVDGFFAGASPRTLQVADAVGKQVASLASAVTRKLEGDGEKPAPVPVNGSGEPARW
ncbi:MAG: SPFH domain-containing protein [Myxococcota bacterium]